MREEILICQCGDPAHQLVVFYDDDPQYPCVYVSVHLSPERNFLKRLWRGLKYIFSNKRSIYGDFDEIVLKPQDAGKLQDAVDILKGITDYEALMVDDTVLPIILQPNKYKS
jgi:hypothetical protein